MISNLKLVIVCLFITAVAGCSSNLADSDVAKSTISPSKIEKQVGFFVVGDTGYVSYKSGMTKVAKAVEAVCGLHNCHFGMMTGDNIYPDGAAGGKGDAEMFESRFIKPYGSLKKLGQDFRIYVGLGNHDWYTSREGALAQVRFHENTRPFYMDGLFYRVSPKGLNGLVDLFIIDTEMLLASEMLPDYAKGPNGEMVPNGKLKRGGTKNAIAKTEVERQQLAWFGRELRNSKAKWKIVLGHHPLWQSRADSKFRQSVRLREMLLPLLCQYADAYVAGHQHTMELHSDSCPKSLSSDGKTEPLVHIVSGAGAKKRSVNPSFQSWQQKQFPQLNPIWTDGDRWGFAYLNIENDQLTVNMISVADDGRYENEVTHFFNNRR